MPASSSLVHHSVPIHLLSRHKRACLPPDASSGADRSRLAAYYGVPTHQCNTLSLLDSPGGITVVLQSSQVTRDMSPRHEVHAPCLITRLARRDRTSASSSWSSSPPSSAASSRQWCEVLGVWLRALDLRDQTRLRLPPLQEGPCSPGVVRSVWVSLPPRSIRAARRGRYPKWALVHLRHALPADPGFEPFAESLELLEIAGREDPVLVLTVHARPRLPAAGPAGQVKGQLLLAL